MAGSGARPGRPAILYTSGTTARPKGVIHTHETLRYMTGLSEQMEMSAERVAAVLTPMTHLAGFWLMLSAGSVRANRLEAQSKGPPQRSYDPNHQSRSCHSPPSRAECLKDRIFDRDSRAVASKATKLFGGGSILRRLVIRKYYGSYEN